MFEPRRWRTKDDAIINVGPKAAKFLALVDQLLDGELNHIPEPAGSEFTKQIVRGLIFRLLIADPNRSGDRFLFEQRSKPKAATSDRQLRLRRFQDAYLESNGVSHSQRVVNAGKRVGIKRREAFDYAKELGLRSSKKSGA